MKVYAAYYANEIRNVSSSGGIFSILAAHFDVIYGVAMTEDCYSCEFLRAKEDITRLRGSKYFQANVGDTFKKVKSDLLSGEKVLFTGTGCQVNGLKCFLGKDYDNLLCVDVICHGVPSPALWRKYVEYQEKKNGGKLKHIDFRCKDSSWVDFGMKEILINDSNEKKLYISKENDPYMQLFLKNYSLRPSCYNCAAKKNKMSDLTIADFWGIEDVAPEMNDGKGTSLVITRTEKGQKLFEQIKNDTQWKEVGYNDGVKCNPSEYSSVGKPKERACFFADMNKMTIQQLEKKYVYGPLWKRIGRKVKAKVKNFGGGGKVTQKTNATYGMLFTFEKKV